MQFLRGLSNTVRINANSLFLCLSQLQQQRRRLLQKMVRAKSRAQLAGQLEGQSLHQALPNPMEVYPLQGEPEQRFDEGG